MFHFAGVLEGGGFVDSERHQRGPDDLVPLISFVSDQKAFVAEEDLVFGSERKVARFLELLETERDAGLAVAEAFGQIDGVDLARAFLLLEHQDALKIVLARFVDIHILLTSLNGFSRELAGFCLSLVSLS